MAYVEQSVYTCAFGFLGSVMPEGLARWQDIWGKSRKCHSPPWKKVSRSRTFFSGKQWKEVLVGANSNPNDCNQILRNTEKR
jgi:hypothetical protein